jgi:hypothetical protein
VSITEDDLNNKDWWGEKIDKVFVHREKIVKLLPHTSFFKKTCNSSPKRKKSKRKYYYYLSSNIQSVALFRL